MVTMLQKQLIEKTKQLREMAKAEPAVVQESPNTISMLQSQVVDKNNTIKDLNVRLMASNEKNTGLANKVSDLERSVAILQQQLMDKNNDIQKLRASIPPPPAPVPDPDPLFTRIPIVEDDSNGIKSKSDPEVMVDPED